MKKLFLPLLVACFALLSQSVWADNYAIVNFSTNMGTYQSYTVNNLKDGNFSSKFWSNANQASGDYILADLGAVQPLQIVNLYFESGDQPNGGKVSISSDGEAYEDLGSFTSAEIGGAATNYLVAISAANKSARYVRFEITNPNTGAWFQMKEIEIPIPDIAAPERTISVSVSDATMGSAYIGTAGTTSVTQEGIVVITAVANDGYEFTGWTLDGNKVSSELEFMDNTEGDKHYVANFILDLYSDFCKPGVTAGGNKRAQSRGEILNATGVEEGSTTVFSPSGSNSSQEWANKADVVNIETGATFDLQVTYGDQGWNDISVFMMRSSGTNTLIYGPYEGSWTTGGSPSTIFTNIQDAADAATADATTGVATFPIAMPADLTVGETVIIRFLVHGSDVGDDPCTSDIHEGNFCDYLFYTAKEGDPSGVEGALAEEAVKVYAVNGGVNIMAENVTANIYAVNGAFVRSVSVAGAEFVSLPAGFYAVVVNGKTYKVSVE